jgi:hypothetical protein
LSFTGLAPEETDPTQTEVSQLKMAMLVDEEVIWFQIADIGRNKLNELEEGLC